MLFVVGIPVAWILGRRNKQRPDLRFAIDQEELIAPEDSLVSGGLGLTFRGAKLQRLCRTYVGVWQKRGDTVRQSDLTAVDPLRIELSLGDSVLSARVVAMSRSQIQPSVRVNQGASKNVATLGFDFLDPKDGFIVEILHEENSPPILTGTLKGGDLREVTGISLSARARARAQMPMKARFGDVYQGRRWLLAMLLLSGLMILGPAVLPFLDIDLGQVVGLEARSNQNAEGVRIVNLIVGGFGIVFILVVYPAMLLSPLFSKFPPSIAKVDQQSSFEWHEERRVAPNPGRYELETIQLAHGDLVRHDTLGVGTVLKVDGTELNRIASVRFDATGVKRLLLRKAPLVKISE
ncbi:hypothetical protein [Microterricola viridarii]|uniref:hypothetical protein n=1 Tax=Microterricola viridarii TaxID=412690 RepID=UPI0015610043|nr:hypothetical protein [Microterricola viridarii]